MTETLILLITICSVAASVLVMFLPALFELRKPKDAGPRLIIGDFVALPAPLTSPITKIIQLPVISDIESEGRATIDYSKFLGFLPNVESFTVE